MSSAVSLPSDIMPTPLAMALAVMGWSPVTMITWVGRGRKASRITFGGIPDPLPFLQNLMDHCLHSTGCLQPIPKDFRYGGFTPRTGSGPPAHNT